MQGLSHRTGGVSKHTDDECACRDLTESLRFLQRAQASTRRRTLVRFCIVNPDRRTSVAVRITLHGGVGGRPSDGGW